jgi:cytochrome b
VEVLFNIENLVLSARILCLIRHHAMTTQPEASKRDELDLVTRLIHLGLMFFALAAWITSGWAEEYEHAKHVGFTVHSWLGMGLATFIGLRLIYGLVGPANVRFSQWVPYTKAKLRFVWEDVLTLLKFRMPERPSHQGLAGLVQTFGLLTFAWLALTGSLLFFYLKPGQEAAGLLHFVMEMHEIGETAIPLFLGLHVGAVVLHALFGNHLWRSMLFLKERA